MSTTETGYPVQFAVDYPDRPLNRLTSAFRIFTVIPIVIVLGALGGSSYSWDSHWGDTGARRRKPRRAASACWCSPPS